MMDQIELQVTGIELVNKRSRNTYLCQLKEGDIFNFELLKLLSPFDPSSLKPIGINELTLKNIDEIYIRTEKDEKFIAKKNGGYGTKNLSCSIFCKITFHGNAEYYIVAIDNDICLNDCLSKRYDENGGCLKISNCTFMIPYRSNIRIRKADDVEMEDWMTKIKQAFSIT